MLRCYPSIFGERLSHAKKTSLNRESLAKIWIEYLLTEQKRGDSYHAAMFTASLGVDWKEERKQDQRNLIFQVFVT
jgi:hypothetical protein